MNQKQVNGCEIQDAAYHRSWVIIQLKLAKSYAESVNADDNDNNANLLNCTQVVKKLLVPWFNYNRVICADSAFALVGCAVKM